MSAKGMQPIYGSVWRDADDHEIVMVVGSSDPLANHIRVLVLDPGLRVDPEARFGKVTSRSSTVHRWRRVHD